MALRKRVMGIEPTYLAWKASVLPLNYTRAVPKAGIEPATRGFSVLCSTNWAIWASHQHRSFCFVCFLLAVDDSYSTTRQEKSQALFWKKLNFFLKACFLPQFIQFEFSSGSGLRMSALHLMVCLAVDELCSILWIYNCLICIKTIITRHCIAYCNC